MVGRAGLLDGDIITQFAGLPVGSIAQLRDVIAGLDPDQEVEVLGIRGNQGFRARARTPAEQPIAERLAATPSES